MTLERQGYTVRLLRHYKHQIIPQFHIILVIYHIETNEKTCFSRMEMYTQFPSDYKSIKVCYLKIKKNQPNRNVEGRMKPQWTCQPPSTRSPGKPLVNVLVRATLW